MSESLHRRSALLGASLLLANLAWGCAPGVAGSSCNSDFDCGNGFFCNGAGVCQESSVICKSFENCGENQICASGVCVNGCRMDGCPSGQTCNRSLDQCVALVPDEGDTGTSGGQGSSTSAGGSTSGTTGQTGGTTTYGGSTTGSAASSTGTTGTSTGSAVGSATSSGGSTGRSTGSISASSSGTTTGGAACTVDTWANFAGTFFTTYCNECHNWTQATVAKDASVVKELKGGFMPPRKDKQPSAQDLNRILTWIGCGEP